MATNNTCRACFRSLKTNLPSHHASQTPLFRVAALNPQSLLTHSRCFTTTYKRSKDAAPATNAKTPTPTPVPEPQDSTVVRFAKELRRRAAPATETYIAYGGTERLFKECARHAKYTIPQALEKDGEIPRSEEGEDLGVGEGWWHDELKLPATFATWSQVTFLHMYLLTTRIRHFPPETAPKWHQHLVDHFFSHAEGLMIKYHQIHTGGIRSRYLKDVFAQWRGVLASYDEGLMKGDAVLAAAIWRNLFKGKKDVDVAGLAQVTAWMRRELARLEQADDLDIGSGSWEFESPKEEVRTVLIESKSMREGVDAAPTIQ